MSGRYDLLIVGGGISGASLLYTTAKFTDIDSIALIEKESEIGAINSKYTNNSQTLHFGDIETNYSFDKAEEVKEGAEIMAGYLENHDPDEELHAKRSKMVLAVGDEEVDRLDRRYTESRRSLDRGVDGLSDRPRLGGLPSVADLRRRRRAGSVHEESHDPVRDGDAARRADAHAADLDRRRRLDDRRRRRG